MQRALENGDKADGHHRGDEETERDIEAGERVLNEAAAAHMDGDLSFDLDAPLVEEVERLFRPRHLLN